MPVLECKLLLFGAPLPNFATLLSAFGSLTNTNLRRHSM